MATPPARSPQPPPGKPYNPRLHDRPETHPRVDPLIESIAHWMDQAFTVPGGRFRFGFDGVLGLIPGVGDVISTAFSGLLIWRAVQAGVPKAAIGRMMVNVAVDSAVGLIPFLGDLFDFVYKANTRNLHIYRQALRGERDNRRDVLFLAGVGVVLAALIAVPIVAIAVTLQWLL